MKKLIITGLFIFSMSLIAQDMDEKTKISIYNKYGDSITTTQGKGTFNIIDSLYKIDSFRYNEFMLRWYDKKGQKWKMPVKRNENYIQTDNINNNKIFKD